ncbi:hypothetical protein [Caryophanon latum]|uniref:ABC transporter permease n=1 Tax=Caryophanon latum TaxID=33977 RepID=A0A1C0YUJ4_9BACL|nr:hypothetical protein [Caryophanon latum]OCS90846.1 hypothetical protein A6K76_01995 [Caryophanon latum]
MNALISLVVRHNKVFLRNRMLVFFSMLSVIIVIALYAIFLQKTQIDAIEQVMPATSAIHVMVIKMYTSSYIATRAVLFFLYSK